MVGAVACGIVTIGSQTLDFCAIRGADAQAISWIPIMKALPWALFLCTASAFANDKPQYTYQYGVLQGAHLDDSARDCVADSNTSQSAGTIASSSCAGGNNIVYIVTSGGATYILTPRGDQDENRGGLLLRATIAHSVLDKKPPQTPIEIRSDGRHFFVRVGNRESEYSVARVQ